MSIGHRFRLLNNSVEFKFDEDSGWAFSGYASKFGGVDLVGDTILPGAFDSVVLSNASKIKLKYNHETVVGKLAALSQDDVGLYIKGMLTPGHRLSEDVYALLKNDVIDGLSIAFKLSDSVYTLSAKGKVFSKINSLREISVVDYPADLSAIINEVKSAIQSVDSLKSAEALLRDEFGFSWQDATTLVSQIKKAISCEDKRLASVKSAFDSFKIGE